MYSSRYIRTTSSVADDERDKEHSEVCVCACIYVRDSLKLLIFTVL